jgi:3-hydroxyisobutyrate dehydrogenase-like beta-hydroxyacid dehydrogenase
MSPLLDVMGKMVKYVGGSGSANQVKLIHQTLVAGHAVAVAEALALCMATDTDIDAFYDVVCNGGGFAYSRYFEKRTPRMRDGDFSPLFMLDLMRKDAGLAGELAKHVGMDTPLLNQVLAVFDQARNAGYGREDFSAVAHVYEDAIGRRLAEH